MSLYVHGRTNGRTVTEAERAQAARRNQELAAEIRQLEAIAEQLQASVNEIRARLEAERDAARAMLAGLRAETEGLRGETQALIRYRRKSALLPPPVHGGREGLAAATAEIEAHDRGGLERTGPSHGTKARYYGEYNCRCAVCLTWYEGHLTKARDRYRNVVGPARRRQLVAAA